MGNDNDIERFTRFAANARRFRDRVTGLTQEKLADQLGVGRLVVSNIENAGYSKWTKYEDYRIRVLELYGHDLEPTDSVVERVSEDDELLLGIAQVQQHLFRLFRDDKQALKKLLKLFKAITETGEHG